MEINIARQIGAVIREVPSREHDGKPAKVVVASQTYNTSAPDLWEAVTSAERLPRWFSPVTGDLQLGGRYQITGNASGEVLACEPPRRFKVTWEFGGAISWVEVTIEPAPGNSARLRLEHIAYPDDHWKQFGPGATGVGWDLAFVGLSRHIEGSMADTAEGMTWMMSDNGKAFMKQSSEAWRIAAVAGGADAEAAQAAADRTIAAYTGS